MTSSALARQRIAQRLSLAAYARPAQEDEDDDAYGDTLVRERAISRRAPVPVGIVVTADNHLSPALPLLPHARRAERRERLRRGFASAVEYAVEHKARLFVTAGDLFDTPTPTNAERAFVAAQLARLAHAGIACVGIGGERDTPRPSATAEGGEAPQQAYAIGDEGMTYFPAADSPTPRLYTLGELRLAVVGVSTPPGADPERDPLAGIRFADPEGVLARADLGLLIAHAEIEGLEDARVGAPTITRASLAALPDVFRVVVAGHAHRFGRARVGDREVIVPGATERMDFDSAPRSSGFAWLEATPDGLTRIKHITLTEQPRADVELTTARLFPGGIPIAAPSGNDAQPVALATEDEAPDVPVLPVLTPADEAAEARTADDLDLRTLAASGQASADILTMVQRILGDAANGETLVRLRLAGPLTREQYARLPLRDIARYGAQHAFAFELDTRGLELVEPTPAGRKSAPPLQRAPVTTGPLSPRSELDRLLQERLAHVPSTDVNTAADLRAAADLLLARLRATGAPAISPGRPGASGSPDRANNRAHDREANL